MPADPLTAALFNAFSPPSFDLGGENVHLWQASLSQPEPLHRQLSAFLFPDELERAARFYFERDRHRYITARGFLRLLLGAYLQTDPARIRLSYNEFGKPKLDAPHRTRLNFSLAHAQDKVIYSFTPGCRVGVDLEHVRPMPDEDHFAAMFFSDRESRLLGALSGAEKTASFFRLWTCKEAYLKAVGAGLAGELNQVEVAFMPTGEARFLSLGGDLDRAQQWLLELFTPWEGFQAALTVEAPNGNPGIFSGHIINRDLPYLASPAKRTDQGAP